jgi:hypothetical protein
MNLTSKSILLPRDLPILDLPEDLSSLELPDFMTDIVNEKIASKTGRRDFFERFGLLYVYSSQLRNHTNGWYLLFVDREYSGAFQVQREALEHGTSIGEGVYTHSMHPRLHEYKRQVIRERDVQLGQLGDAVDRLGGIGYELHEDFCSCYNGPEPEPPKQSCGIM